jgi:hypothetical protein
MNIIILEITMIARSFYILSVLVLLGLMSTGIGEAKPDGPFYPVKEKGLWGYIDQTGTVVIKPRFEQAGDFSEGLAPVKIGEKWGYVNPSGSVVIEPKFAHAESFKHALARVKVGNLWAYLNKEGTVVWKAKE